MEIPKTIFKYKFLIFELLSDRLDIEILCANLQVKIQIGKATIIPAKNGAIIGGSAPVRSLLKSNIHPNKLTKLKQKIFNVTKRITYINNLFAKFMGYFLQYHTNE